MRQLFFLFIGLVVASRALGQAEPADSGLPKQTAASGDAPAAADPFRPVTNAPLGRKKPTDIVSRLWTDRFGNAWNGKFVRLHGFEVVVNVGARTRLVQFYSLSDADQEYVREVLRSRGDEASIPPPLKPSDGVGESAPRVQAQAAPTPTAPAQPSGRANMPAPPTAGSAFFEELRQRDAQRRQEMAELFEKQHQER